MMVVEAGGVGGRLVWLSAEDGGLGKSRDSGWRGGGAGV